MALDKRIIWQGTFMLPSVTELTGQKRRECEEFLRCRMSTDMYETVCACEPLQYCWGHVHGKHWSQRPDEEEQDESNLQ